jgi:hypothetical protein
MVAQRSEKNSKRDEMGLFAEPVEGPESQSTKGRGSVGVRQFLMVTDNDFPFFTTVCITSLLTSKAYFAIHS